MPLSESFTSEDIPRQRKTAGGPGGGTRNLHDGGSDVFFWVEHLDSRYFFGSRNTPGIFLG